MVNQQRRRASQAGLTIMQVCMFISILLSLAASVYWALMAIEKNEIEGQISHIRAEKQKLSKKFGQLEDYEGDLTELVGAEGDTLDEQTVTSIRDKVVENHDLLKGKEMTLGQIAISLSRQVRNAAQQLRPLRIQQNKLENRLSYQEKREQTYSTKYSAYTSMLNKHKNKLNADREDLNTQIEEIRSSGNDTVEEINSEIETAKEEHADRMTALENELLGIQSQINQLQQQEAEIVQIEETDGEILRITSDGQWVYINIGTEDRVQPGIQFKVYARGRQDQRIEKGKIEVKEVFADYSRCRVISNQGAENPILEGEEIMNPVFSTKEAKVFVLAGNFQNRSLLRRLIEKAGGNVHDTPSVAVDFVVIGDNYEEKSTYKKARQIGIPLIKVEEIQEFLGE